MLNQSNYLAEMFTERSRISLRDTDDKLAPQQARTNYLKDSFSYNGAVLWNSLPNEVRRANTLSYFKMYCRNFLDNFKCLIVYTTALEKTMQVLLRVLALLVLHSIFIWYFCFVIYVNPDESAVII